MMPMMMVSIMRADISGGYKAARMKNMMLPNI